MAKSKNVLVTGGGGFIGKHLIATLKEKGYKVSCMDRDKTKIPPGVRKIVGNILDKKAVERGMKGQDYVYHLAGVLGTSELQFMAAEATEINVIGTLRIFDAAVKNKTKVILVSKPNPWLNTYSITKETSEKFFQMYRRDFGLKGIIVKWFSVYGPGQKHYGVQKAVPTFIWAALHGKPLPVFGNGKQQADFVYAKETTDLTVVLAEHPKAEGKTFEIGTGKGVTAYDLAKLIIKLTKSKSKIKKLPMRIGEDPNAKVIADLREVRKIIKFKSGVNFVEKMQETVEYYIKLAESLKDK